MASLSSGGRYFYDGVTCNQNYWNSSNIERRCVYRTGNGIGQCYNHALRGKTLCWAHAAKRAMEQQQRVTEDAAWLN